MPDTIKLNKDQGIIEIRSYGKVENSDIENSIRRVTEIYKQSGVNKVIVDTTEQESMPSTLKIYSLFSLFPRDLLVAMVVNQEQPTKGNIRFAESVAQNRGIRIKQFNSREDALKWLKK